MNTGGGVAMMVALLLAATGVSAQTFSKATIDTSLLPDLLNNDCLKRDAITTHVCEPIAAMLKAIVPAPTGDHAVISTTDVIQLCAAHNIKDVVCGMAALLEFRYHRVPCWDLNKC
jgi:hypothetical protein